ncbi:MAG TPA: hypothetical protein DCE44_17755 [Verrucomicrobiales bacterium]|nr:hypothetical protein [Verrucomicrobiales bacterium]
MTWSVSGAGNLLNASCPCGREREPRVCARARRAGAFGEGGSAAADPPGQFLKNYEPPNPNASGVLSRGSPNLRSALLLVRD